MKFTFKVIIAGSRSFSDYEKMCLVCDHLLSKKKTSNYNIEIVSGTARGADRMGEQYAKDRGFAIKRFPADWDTYGKSAGFRRNERMAKYADAAIVFWDEDSRGTKHMIEQMKKHKKQVSVNLF